jgi:RHS repeat-associated protein
MDADTAFSAAILLGELTVMNPDAESIMLLAEIFSPKTGSVTELVAQYAAVAALNPIRYRGYYYDAETGYYFLNTRYYNPEWRRFLNADSLFVAGGDAINGSNMYAYCNGNPVMYRDPSGMVPGWIERIEGAFVGFVSDKVSQAASGLFGMWFGPKIGWITDKTEYLIGAIVNTRGGYWFTPWQEKEYNGERDLRTDYNDIPIINLFIKEDMRTNIITEALSGLTGLNITLTGIGAFLLDFHMDRDRYSPNYGNYRSLPGSYQWQKHVGYTWWYDWFFDLGGPIKRKIYQFEVEDRVLGFRHVTQYVVWCWKADYWNLGAGAEIGIYYQDNPYRAELGYFDIDTDNLRVRTLMNVTYKGDPIITNFSQTNWWVCMFVPRVQSPDVDNLDVHLKVAFAGKGRHKDLMKPFFEEGERQHNRERWQEIKWSDTTGKPFRVLCGEHPSQCTCKLLGIIPSPCKYYSDIDMYNLSGWQFEIRY